MASIDEKIIKTTQDALTPLIKKPPLTPKLLSKPPFRFLHDIVTGLIKATGVLADVFSDDEKNHEMVKDKEAKLAFLQKLIEFVEKTNGAKVDVNPRKIVAGAEPEKTNTLLQALAAAVNKEKGVPAEGAGASFDAGSDKPSAEEATSLKKSKKSRDERKEGERDKERDRGERGGDKQDKEDKGEKAEKKDRGDAGEKSSRPSSADRAKGRERSAEKERRKKEAEGSRDRERSAEKTRTPAKEGDDTEERESREAKEARRRERKKRKEAKEKPDQAQETPKRDRDEDSRESGAPSDPAPATTGSSEAAVKGKDVETAEENSADRPAKIPRPSSAKGSRRRKEGRPAGGESDGKEEDFEASGGRGREERKRRTKSRAAHEEDNEESPAESPERTTKLRPPSARPPAKIKRSLAAEPDAEESGNAVANVIEDKGDYDEDDDEGEMIELLEETVDAGKQHDAENVVRPDEGGAEDEVHGVLVKKILEMKKGIEEMEGMGAPGARNGPSRPTAGAEEALQREREKEREMVKKEVSKVRAAIQQLSSAANPLGKMMDYVQEDVEAMQKELYSWKSENKIHLEAIVQEKNITDAELEPLKRELETLETGIVDQIELIRSVKKNILRNEEKIKKMIGNTLSQGGKD